MAAMAPTKCHAWEVGWAWFFSSCPATAIFEAMRTVQIRTKSSGHPSVPCSPWCRARGNHILTATCLCEQVPLFGKVDRVQSKGTHAISKTSVCRLRREPSHLTHFLDDSQPSVLPAALTACPYNCNLGQERLCARNLMPEDLLCKSFSKSHCPSTLDRLRRRCNTEEDGGRAASAEPAASRLCALALHAEPPRAPHRLLDGPNTNLFASSSGTIPAPSPDASVSSPVHDAHQRPPFPVPLRRGLL